MRKILKYVLLVRNDHVILKNLLSRQPVYHRALKHAEDDRSYFF